jgi:glycosyltransferase involved in cell wall biosynthesis
MIDSVFAIIPALNPPDALWSVVGSLTESSFAGVIVIDDGSDASFRPLFDELEALPHVDVLRHAVNLGKGNGLRTGMNHALNLDPGCVGVVTLDADGQHLTGDVGNVAAALREHSEDLILGARAWEGTVPLRSRFGNTLTRGPFRVLAGQSLTDTQTGLRCIFRGFTPTLLHMTCGLRVSVHYCTVAAIASATSEFSRCLTPCCM